MITVISPVQVGRHVAGPALRAANLAAMLARHWPTTLAAPADRGLPVAAFSLLVPHRTGDLRRLLQESDAVITQGAGFALVATLRWARTVVADLYDPHALEVLERERGGPRRVTERHLGHLRATQRFLLRRAAHVLYATEPQRDLLLGALLACGRPLHGLYATSRKLSNVLVNVPYGINLEGALEPLGSAAGVAQRAVGREYLMARHPQIGMDSIVLLWGGGLWPWLDPGILVSAMARLEGSACQRVKLLFLGGGAAANPDIPAARAREELLAQARRVGLLDTSILFASEWIPYEEHRLVLAGADVGVSTHAATLECRFSIRARYLDCLWAARPILGSAGDPIADYLAAEGAGWTAPPGDAAGLAARILQISATAASREAASAKVAAVRELFTWERAVAPLLPVLEQTISRSATGATLAERARGLHARAAWAVAELANVARHGGWASVLANVAGRR
ncbi:MAG: hypothetical protein HYV63_00635 [Candidatus Schekmanbacteria bacterium]|nr:hypothetical protein [Candidatus Schekmanbacteria bacterium]